MTNPEQIARVRSRLRFAFGAIALLTLGPSATANAQGLVQGVQQGAREGNKAAGPVGGVLGGAIGGVVGVVGGVVGVVTGGNNNRGGQAPAAKDSKQGEAPKQGECEGSRRRSVRRSIMSMSSRRSPSLRRSAAA